ncbi:MAG: CYTH domain-containing protein [Verrucomicrobiales bacterium]|nr:CYTH domain-containing protein [Verrucomicrobiales bacterium]
MGQEIERKFLVRSDGWRTASPVRFVQGYLSVEKERTVRVRIEGEEARLTIKGVSQGITRSEFEYSIPLADAEVLLEDLCQKPLIDKHRTTVKLGDHIWEIDEFHGANEGLIVAEIELESIDEPFEKPDWLGPEVSEDPRYYNANLVNHPYSQWSEEE